MVSEVKRSSLTNMEDPGSLHVSLVVSQESSWVSYMLVSIRLLTFHWLCGLLSCPLEVVWLLSCPLEVELLLQWATGGVCLLNDPLQVT